jgi:hypothetical protein
MAAVAVQFAQMYTPTLRPILLSLCAFTVLFCLSARPVAAQNVGVRVGASNDPDQFVFGGNYETKPLVDRVTFRPNVEIGLGNDVTVTTFNFELAYHFDYPSSKPWNVYAGGGPALVWAHSHGNSQTGGGFNFLVGIQSRQGLFGEVKAGVMDSPNFKFIIGYVFHY